MPSGPQALRPPASSAKKQKESDAYGQVAGKGGRGSTMTLPELCDLAQKAGLEIRQVHSLRPPQVAIIEPPGNIDGDHHAYINDNTGLPIFTLNEAREVLEDDITFYNAVEDNCAFDDAEYDKERAQYPHLSDEEFSSLYWDSPEDVDESDDGTITVPLRATAH